MHPVLTPHELVNDESVLLVDWLVADGNQVSPGAPIATIETSKATLHLEAPSAGYLRIKVPKGTEVKVGGVVAYIAANTTDAIPAEPKSDHAPLPPQPLAPAPKIIEKSAPAPASLPTKAPSVTRFSQKALALLQQHGLNPAQFDGYGLVTADRIQRIVNGDNTPSPASQPAAPTPSSNLKVRVEQLPRRKRMEAKYLMAGQNAVGSLVSIICPTRGLKAAVQRHPELSGGPLPLILHETARLLKKYPAFNAFHNDGAIHYYELINLGFALDAEHGLKVPVIVNADTKGISELKVEVENFVLNYLDNTLPVEALANGTFTVTDLSGEDVHSFAPLINQGQAAILGIGAEYFPPGSSEGVFNLILAFDHRLTEGRVAAAFLKDLRERIQSYERVLLDHEGSQTSEQCCSRCLRPLSELTQLNVPLLLGILPSGRNAPVCANCISGW